MSFSSVTRWAASTPGQRTKRSRSARVTASSQACTDEGTWMVVPPVISRRAKTMSRYSAGWRVMAEYSISGSGRATPLSSIRALYSAASIMAWGTETCAASLPRPSWKPRSATWPDHSASTEASPAMNLSLTA